MAKVIRAVVVVTVVLQTTMCWAQMASEEELGTGIQTVIQGYTVAVLLEAVRIRWDNNNGILLTKNGVLEV